MDMVAAGIAAALSLLYVMPMLRGYMRNFDGSRWTRRLDWIAPFRNGIGRVRHAELMQAALQRPAMSLAVLEGGSCPPEKLLRWAAESAAMGYAVLLGSWLLAAASGNGLVGGAGTAIAAVVPALRARDLGRKAEERKRQVRMELPVMLSRLAVWVNAGENVRRALDRCAGRPEEGGHPLYRELRNALAAMDRGESLNGAMEEFGRRCAVPEAKRFSAVLLMNAKRGGEALLPALREMNRELWDQRKASARTLGEQASARLTFPLAVIFLLIIVLVGAPAVISL